MSPIIPVADLAIVATSCQQVVLLGTVFTGHQVVGAVKLQRGCCGVFFGKW